MNKIYKKSVLTMVCVMLAATSFANDQYTVLDIHQYNKTVADARAKVAQILEKLHPDRHLDANTQVASIVNQLADIPYIHKNGMGEGDWQSTSSIYRPGAVHVKQNPVYRLDGLNCQTFVQVAMALLHSNNLSQFDKNILQISYGAAGNPGGEIVHYYNRNNFVDADFNPVNQRNGWLTDITSQGMLSSYAKQTHAAITRQKWFLNQQHDLAENVQVLANSSGPSMASRFKTLYSALNFPRFNSEEIVVSYIPREKLAIRQAYGRFAPNQALLDKIPTPAVAEIVRDVNRWNYFGTKIKDIIGSELTISHLGLLYRQGFNYGDLIYHKTTCAYDSQNKKICYVRPITCQKEFCEELMFAHATDALPMRYFWYQTSDGKYVCSPHAPKSGIRYTSCNRVVTSPFYDYLTDYQLGSYWNMELWSILGVHFEKLN